MNTNQKAIPAEMAKEFEAIKQEVIWLHAKWRMYRQLFGIDEQRIELLNQFAPASFRVCQDVLLDDVLLTFWPFDGSRGTG